MSALRHRAARDLTAADIGTRITVATPNGSFTGGLSDVEQHPTAHRTRLWIGGHLGDVRDDTTVTTGDLDLPGSTT